ncbi:MAG: sulfotransferase domain-containing protein [Sulfitobacter sp.]
MDKTFGNLFLNIGAMKAGTTSLSANLSRHPELHFSAEKELHYFYHRHVQAGSLAKSVRQTRAREKYIPILRGEPGQKELPKSRLQRILQNRVGHLLPRPPLNLDGLSTPDAAWIENYLSNPVDDAWFNRLFPLSETETYACEFSNLSALLPGDIWTEIYSKAEKLRVLYTLRDPVKRLWSHTKFHLGMTKSLHLLDSWKLKDFEAFARQPDVWGQAEYGQTCDTLHRSLPQGTWRVQSSEDMNADPMGSLRAIEEFLGIAPFNYPRWLIERRLVASASIPMPDFYADLFRKDVTRIKGELSDLGIPIPKNWI